MLAAGHAAHRVDEFAAAHLLEHVARCAGDDGFEQRLVVGVRREHQARHLGQATADLAAQLDPVAIGQADVEDGHIGLHGEHPGEARLDRIGLADDREVVGGVDQCTHTLTNDLVVVDQEDTDGRFVGKLRHPDQCARHATPGTGTKV